MNYKKLLGITTLFPNMSKNLSFRDLRHSNPEDVMISNHQARSHILMSKELSYFFSGGYRSRTDDPLLAKQVL